MNIWPLNKSNLNLEEAKGVCKKASIAVFVSLVITLLLIWFKEYLNKDSLFYVFVGEYKSIDLLLFALLGFSLLKFSRTGALLLVINWISSKIYFLYFIPLNYTGLRVFLITSLIFLYFFWRGLEGSFRYHRLRLEGDQNYRSHSKRSYFLWSPIVVVVMLSSLILVLQSVSIIKHMTVVNGDRLSSRDSAFLVEQGIVTPNEKIDFFYSDGIMSILEDGNLLTNMRLISYEKGEEDYEIYAEEIEKVSGFRVYKSERFFENTIVEIKTSDGSAFHLFLANDSNGDERFILELKRRLGQNKFNGEINNVDFENTIFYRNGNKYEWENHGQGAFTYSTGSKYVGEFKESNFHGQGTLTSKNGSKYVGEWKNDERHGQGTQTFGEGKWKGSKYVGEFKDGKLNGQGIFTYADGQKYVGEFKDGKQWNGIYYDENGKSIIRSVNGEKIKQ
jgi:hypothetical protein